MENLNTKIVEVGSDANYYIEKWNWAQTRQQQKLLEFINDAFEGSEKNEGWI